MLATLLFAVAISAFFGMIVISVINSLNSYETDEFLAASQRTHAVDHV